ncbi:MAG: type III pantothenate kinase [Bacteroidota bacterium]
MDLVVDVGNTAVKLAVYRNAEPIARVSFPLGSGREMTAWLKQFDLHRSLLVSVVAPPEPLVEYLRSATDFHLFDGNTALPVRNEYATAATLGKDRLVNACAAASLYPAQDVLIIDAGTCLKFDLVTSDGRYLGGSIAPGLSMRFEALHDYCPALPRVEPEGESPLTGNSTDTSIRSGVLNGITAEISGMINRYRAEYPGIHVVLTGGDTDTLVNRLQKDIFAVPGLTLHGLHAILSNLP